MKEVADRLYVGTVRDVVSNEAEWSYVSTAQTVHYPLMGWNRTFNKPDRNHPNYIILEQDHHLSLNWVDGPAHLYKLSGPETFQRVLDFIDRERSAGRNVLIRCDQGHSRSPSVALLYMAKRLQLLPADSFQSARAAFLQLYPGYQPAGIAEYIRDAWEDIA